MKVGVNAITLSLPFGKASSPQEVTDILSSTGIVNLTIPIRSPTWGIAPEIITINELTKMAEMIIYNNTKKFNSISLTFS